MWLLWYRNQASGTAWCSEETLARRMGKKVTEGRSRTVERAVAELANAGLVEVRQMRRQKGHRHAGRFATNEYRVVDPDERQDHRATDLSPGAHLTERQICRSAITNYQDEKSTTGAHAHEEFDLDPLQGELL